MEIAPKHNDCTLMISVGPSDHYIIKEEYAILEYLVLCIIRLVKLDQFLLLQENKMLPIITMKGMKSNWRNKSSDEVELKEQIIALVTVNPRISKRDLSRQTGCSR